MAAYLIFALDITVPGGFMSRIRTQEHQSGAVRDFRQRQHR
jgi:hypothetical protein